ITLTEALRASGELGDVGGSSYLADLVARVPSAANVMHYARIVRDRSVLRSLITAANQIAAIGYDASDDVKSLLDQAEQSILSIADGEVRQSFVRMDTLLNKTFETIELLHKHKQAVTGVSTGFKDLDRLTAGLQKSDLIIVAARPGMGKTALCLNIAANAALAKPSTGVAVFSLEMAKEQLAMRMLCSESRMNLAAVRTGHFAD